MDDHYEECHPLVSILVPVYNGAKIAARCLESLLKLDYPAFEIWVLDDCSMDQTVDKICSHFPNVHLYQNPKRLGFSASVNNGVRLAKGEIIALVNMDAWVDVQWLKALVTRLGSDPQIALVGSKILEPDNKVLQHAGAWVDPSGFTQHFGRGEIDQGQYQVERECDYVCGAAVAFRRDVFESLGGFDERFYPAYFEDLDFSLRLKKDGCKVVYVPGAIAWHEENITSGKRSQKYFYRYHKNRLQFVFKWLLKDNGLKQQLKLEWEAFRKPWPLRIRLVWLLAFFSAVGNTMWFRIFRNDQAPPREEENSPQQDLHDINQSYDTFTLPKESSWKYWARRCLGRVIGYFLVRQRDFNASVVRLFNHDDEKIHQLELQQKTFTEQLSQLNDQIRKLQKRQELLLNYLCESIGPKEQEEQEQKSTLK